MRPFFPIFSTRESDQPIAAGAIKVIRAPPTAQVTMSSMTDDRSPGEPREDDLSTKLRDGLLRGVAPSGGWVLVTVKGPDAGRRLSLDGRARPHALIGKSPVCDLELRDPLVSRRHVAIDVGERVRVTDLGSTNGTLLNAVAIERAYATSGDTIRIGDTEMTLYAAPALPVSVEETRSSFGPLLGESPAMRRLYPWLAKLAASNVPVIIEGETGTGKEVVAEAIHAASARAAGPFVVFDCTTVPPSLFESELFGHERGAFTGAASARQGMFEEAEGGTLLIDEIGDLDLTLQTRLLRALDQHEIRRVGSNKSIKVDVRVLAATRRDLDKMVQEERFRDDLFFRLAVGRVALPPLRERAGDVRVLARHIWSTQRGPEGGPPASVLERWDEYGWPGNVRELANAVMRQIALGGSSPAEEDTRTGSAERGESDPASSDVIARVLADGLPFAHAKRRVNEEFVRRYVETVLARHGGNVSNAASASGLARRYFQLLRAGRR
jgi:two-component system, NtrC family, response regulator HydG